MRSNSVRVSDRRSTLPSNAAHSTKLPLAGGGMNSTAATSTSTVGNPQVIDKWHFKHLISDPNDKGGHRDKNKVPLLYQKVRLILCTVDL